MMKNLPLPRAVFFDFDLTLVDSLSAGTRSLQALKRHGIDYTQIPFKEIWGMKLEVLVKKLSLVSYPHYSPQEIKKLNIGFMRKYYAHCHIVGRRLLKELTTRGIMTAIISNNSYTVIQSVLHAPQNIGIHFDKILSAGHLKGQASKAAAIKLMCREFKLKSANVWYVGDHPNDIRFAREAGVTAVAVATGLHSARVLQKFQPDILVKRLDELGVYFSKKGLKSVV